MSCGSKGIFRNAPCLMYEYHHVITDFRWLAMQKLECLEKGTIFYEIKKSLTCASDDTFLEVIVL